MIKNLYIFLFVYVLVTLTSETNVHGPNFSFYHTSENLEKEIQLLKESCSFISSKKITNDPSIDLITINDRKEYSKQKAFFLFGEHAREMISPETGLFFLKNLCKNKGKDTKIDYILNNFEIQMVLNANPTSRRKVEEGDFCLRVNENGVDLNRNWDSHWVSFVDSPRMDQTFPGNKPFSEKETIAVRQALSEFLPLIFLTVHSGTMGMYTPYAYSNEKGTYNEENMLSILSELNQNHCNCRSGAAGKEVGYLCPGTCLDYAYDKLKVPYSFAWEIYDKDFDFNSLIEIKSVSFLQKNEHKKKPKIYNFKSNQISSCFIQTKSKMENELPANECFAFFNPNTKNDYEIVVENWSNALIDLLISVDEIEKKKKPDFI